MPLGVLGPTEGMHGLLEQGFFQEFIIGGELFSLLQKQEKLGFNHARKYAASVLEAFIYLHKKDIIYRDLKPENLLIDLEGYIRVVDFGFAKQVQPAGLHRQDH